MGAVRLLRGFVTPFAWDGRALVRARSDPHSPNGPGICRRGLDASSASLPTSVGSGPVKTFSRHPNRWRGSCRVSFALAVLWAANAAVAAECGGDFDVWLDGIRAEATAAVSCPRRSSDSMGSGRARRSWRWTVPSGCSARIGRPSRADGERLSTEGGSPASGALRPGIAQAEAEFGVPAPVIAAVWGLETDFGAVQGDFDTLAALATLAHDCRRPDLFRPQ